MKGEVQFSTVAEHPGPRKGLGKRLACYCPSPTLSPQNKRFFFNLLLSLKHRHATAGLRQRADRQRADQKKRE